MAGRETTRGRRGAAERSASGDSESVSHLLAALMDTIPANIYFKDTRSRFTLVNRAMARLFNLSDPDQAVGKTDFDFFTREHASKAYADEQSIMRTGKPIRGKEEKETWPGGGETWVSTTKMPLRDGRGKTVGTFGISHDITERKKTEEELKRHRDHLEELVRERTRAVTAANEHLRREIAERLRIGEALRQERDRAHKYLDIAGTMIVVLDTRGRVTLINRKGCEILGYAEKELVGRDWFGTVLSRAQARKVKAIFRKMTASETELVPHYENDVMTRDGSRRTIAWHNSLLRDDKGRVSGTLSSGEDVTERRLAEKALLQSERLEAVGTLAGGVALRVNNIISVINGQAATIAANVISGTRAHQSAKGILDATRHASDLTQRLSKIARAEAGDAGRGGPVALSRVAQDVVNLVSAAFAEKKVKVTLRNPEGMPSVTGESGDLFDVLMVLLMNAAEAMSEGGTISIAASVRRVGRPAARLNPEAKAGEFAVLSVRDTGLGIRKEDIPRIFDPFFSTKKAGASSGLGLPFAMSIIRRMGGWIAVQSSKGEGTTFRLFMPRGEDLPERKATNAARLAGGRCILVVDDHSESVARMRDALHGEGYRTCVAGDMNGGLEMLRKHGERIAVCVVDALLPGQDGHALVRELSRMGAESGLILTSGFSREYVRTLFPTGGWSFLQKPFEPDQLVESVHSAVRRRAGGEAGAE